MRDFPEHADAGGAYALLGWAAFALYAGITFALGGHTFMWFLIGVGVVVGLLVVILIVMSPIIVSQELGKLRGRRERRKFPEVHRTGPIPGAGGLTYEKQDAQLREYHRSETLRYQFGYLWHHLRHPEHWGLIGDDPDHGCYVETRAQLESSTTEQERMGRSADRLIGLVIVVGGAMPCAVAALLFFPVLMIFPSGMSMWKLAEMAYVGTGLIVAGCYAHDRIAIRARRRAQRRAILAMHP